MGAEISTPSLFWHEKLSSFLYPIFVPIHELEFSNQTFFSLYKMLDTLTLKTWAASPSIQATAALLFFSFVLQWYFSLPPKPNFPRADLDEKDWHGSLERAKSKVWWTPGSLIWPCYLRFLEVLRAWYWTIYSFKTSPFSSERTKNSSLYPTIFWKSWKTCLMPNYPSTNKCTNYCTESTQVWELILSPSSTPSKMNWPWISMLRSRYCKMKSDTRLRKE